MSEIFSPGSVAGPQGPSGAAGSLANVKSLTDNVLPTMVQLFDYTRATENSTVNADGTIGSFGSFSVSPLVYCPGALYAISDLPIRIQAPYCYFALYDANGNFLETLTSFAGITLTSNNTIPCATAFPLPGTQTYVRFTWQDGALGVGSYGPVASSVASASFVASTVAPTIPSPYQPFGFDSVFDVNNKIAAVTSDLTATTAQFASIALPGGPLALRNAFNYQNVLSGYSIGSDGTVVANPGWTTTTVYVPHATSMIANVPIRCQSPTEGVCIYDATGTFLGDISDTFSASVTNNQLNANTTVSLPGDQTYMKFCYLDAGWNAYGWAGSPESGVLYAGTVASPPPSAITALNQSSAFPGNASPNVRTASSLGASPAQDMNTTAVLNAFLATASASNPIKLILDGMFLVDGLVISSNGYTTIEGTGAGSGITLIDNTPQDAIRIGAYTAAVGDSEGVYNVAAPARTATNIVLRDFTINPNSLSGGGGQSNANANQPVSGAIAHSTYGAILTSATNILVDNVNFLQSTTYALCLSNVGFAKVANCRFESTGTLHDGVHIDGPSEDIGIVNCDFATGDDAIALNAPEGFGGDISRVTITNCRFNGSLSIMRAYASLDPGHMPSNNVHKIRNVSLSNCTGTVNETAFVIGIQGGGYSATSSVDQIQDFLIENCTFSAPLSLAIISNTAGSITFRGVNFVPLSAQPVIAVDLQVGELVLDGVAILRNPDGYSAPSGLVYVGATLGRLSLLNCRVVDEDGSSYAALPCLIQFSGGTVGALQLEAVDLTHVTALVSSGGFGSITALRGSGVMGTGAQVPDSVMDNNALYLSSDASGAPSIKLGGTAKRLTLA
jgi:hypothetical protein